MDALFLLLLGYCLVQRLSELCYSKRNQQILFKDGFIKRESIASLSAMIALHATWYLATLLEWQNPFIHLSYAVRLSAAGLFIAAQLLRYWMFWSLGSNWNISVMAPSKSSKNSFVSSGPYRYVRHPNYLALAIEVAALPLAGNAVFTSLTLSLANAILVSTRITVEEEHLFQRPGYAEVMGAKPRFFPGF